VLLAHDVAGSGDPVLLLHPGVADRRVWQAQWDPLAARFRVIRCDLRGFGDTPIPPERFSNAADVVELLDHLDVERAAVVGSSFGGRVALEVAATHPEQVTRLVLLCPALAGLDPTPDAEAFDEREEALVEANDLDGLVELNVATWLGPEADDAARDFVREMQRHAFEVQLAADAEPMQPEMATVDVDPARIACPAVVVAGRHDMDHFQAIGAHLVKTMPRARLVELPWAGHLPGLERPGETTDLIIEALSQD
jgi:pimeloyl-ACP methyl ester carboxylesterase